MINKINISPDRQKLIVYVVLTVVTLTVFWQVNQYDFIFDDVVYVTENSHIQTGITLDGFRWAFSTKDTGLWNPLVWLSLMFDYQLFGLNAGGYHLTNIILHIMSTLLLFCLFNRMTGMVWRSAFVAGLFALHPLHVESVAWIAERKDVLSVFFWMLTLCLYVYYTEKPDFRKYLLVLFSFVLALMSKPMVVTLPVIMILLDYWPLKRFESRKGNLFLWQLREKIPFFILSAILVIITLHTPNEKETFIKSYSLSSRLANAPVSFVTYLEKTFWPHDMAVFYPFSDQLPLCQVLGASLLILVISVVVIIMRKRLQYLFVGWLWYAITIAPVIGIIQVSVYPYAMADRYHYLPSVGISVMLAWGTPSLIKNEKTRKNILFPTAILFLIIMTFITWKQCGYWKNSATLFNYALQVTEDNYVAHNNFGLAMFEKGKIEEATYHYNKAIRIAPDYIYAYNNRGITYGELGQYQLAIDDFNNAIHITPAFVDAYYNRGVVYTKLGQYQHAIEDYSKAIQIKPDDKLAYLNRGFVYTKLGQYQHAIEDYNKAIRITPNYADAYNNRGLAYLLQDNKELGCRDAQKACLLGTCRTLERAKGNGLCR
ncbi:MAG: tetratricopeptide repeat protein [Deltaproteobacteria bacterium]|nr:tetratricopeptide repeat protein [Deltaproteobacteria bacterium]